MLLGDWGNSRFTEVVLPFRGAPTWEHPLVLLGSDQINWICLKRSILQSHAFTHRGFYNWHFYTNTFTHRRFYTQKRKGCAGRFKIAILLQFLVVELHSLGKSCGRTCEIAILQHVLAMEPRFVRKDSRDAFKIPILLDVLAIEPHFARKGCDRTSSNRNFTSVFGDPTSFRAKGLGFVPSCSRCLAP